MVTDVIKILLKALFSRKFTLSLEVYIMSNKQKLLLTCIREIPCFSAHVVLALIIDYRIRQVSSLNFVKMADFFEDNKIYFNLID